MKGHRPGIILQSLTGSLQVMSFRITMLQKCNIWRIPWRGKHMNNISVYWNQFSRAQAGWTKSFTIFLHSSSRNQPDCHKRLILEARAHADKSANHSAIDHAVMLKVFPNALSRDGIKDGGIKSIPVLHYFIWKEISYFGQFWNIKFPHTDG